MVEAAGAGHFLPPRYHLGLLLGRARSSLGGVNIRLQHRVILRLNLLLLTGVNLLLAAGILNEEILASGKIANVVVPLRVQILLVDPVLVWLAAVAEVGDLRSLGRVTSLK